MNFKKMFMTIGNKLGIVANYELVEYLEIEDPIVLAKAIKNRSEEHYKTADSWEYLCRLIDEEKLTDEFVKKNREYFTLGYLLSKNYFTFEDLRKISYWKYFGMTESQKADSPLWFKLRHPALFSENKSFTTSDKKTTFKMTISIVYGLKLMKLVISNENNIYAAPIESALDFKVSNGKLYFGTATHDFDIAWESEEDKENLALLSDLLSSKVLSNVKEMKSNARKLAEAPAEQHKELLAAMKENKKGMDPFLAGALGMGLGLIIGSD